MLVTLAVGSEADVSLRTTAWQPSRPCRLIVAVLAVVLVWPLSGSVRAAEPVDKTFAERAVHQVYQPAAERFSEAAARLLAAAKASCGMHTPEALETLLSHFDLAVGEFSSLELYRTGPLLEENRQNRLFYWPDKRRVGERQMRTLLADEAAASLTASDMASKSVALQGFPALERLLFDEHRPLHGSDGSDSPNCQVVVAIAGNIDSMASAMHRDWQDDAPQVRSLLMPDADSEFYRNEEEVLRSLVTQILVGADVIRDRKLAVLVGEQADIKAAPLWRSGQSLHMIRNNLDSLRALTIDTGLADATDLDNELAFEFRSADGMLQKLQELPDLTDEDGKLTTEAQSLLRSLMAVVDGIRYTLNDRFVVTLGISPGFNSEDGD